MSIFPKHFQVEYFHFEYYYAFVNSINTKAASSAFVGPFQRFSNAHPTKSFLKNLSKIN